LKGLSTAENSVRRFNSLLGEKKCVDKQRQFSDTYKIVLQTVDQFEISYLGAPFSWLEKPRNRMGRDPDCMADVLMGLHRSTFSKTDIEFNSFSPRAISGLFQP
jgi:hypothetical protein